MESLGFPPRALPSEPPENKAAKQTPTTSELMSGEVHMSSVHVDLEKNDTHASPLPTRPRGLSGRAGTMWTSFVHHVPHPFWKDAVDHKATPKVERRAQRSVKVSAS